MIGPGRAAPLFRTHGSAYVLNPSSARRRPASAGGDARRSSRSSPSKHVFVFREIRPEEEEPSTGPTAEEAPGAEGRSARRPVDVLVRTHENHRLHSEHHLKCKDAARISMSWCYGYAGGSYDTETPKHRNMKT
ncbi:hypothetical protein EYF80_048652 [Liparis tanakae]|uniref:Uncharacterized protein n=1 Tax=Liparis tanakae TaxID=230148 RepID=A0A4Z2FLN7_9TELE|nr:hypothetical protein EYF80_048652 [Liparis tanakae]